MQFTLDFLQLFIWFIYLVFPLLIFFIIIISCLGLLVASIEQWKKYDGLYWAFITATTVGYGDIRPLSKVSKVLSVAIALIGMMLTGIIIAVTLQASTLALEKHTDKHIIEQVKEALTK